MHLAEAKSLQMVPDNFNILDSNLKVQMGDFSHLSKRGAPARSIIFIHIGISSIVDKSINRNFHFVN